MQFLLGSADADRAFGMQFALAIVGFAVCWVIGDALGRAAKARRQRNKRKRIALLDEFIGELIDSGGQAHAKLYIERCPESEVTLLWSGITAAVELYRLLYNNQRTDRQRGSLRISPGITRQIFGSRD